MRRPKEYLSLINPFESVRTKKVLQVNPTLQTFRKDAESTHIYVYDFDKESVTENTVESIESCFKYIDTA